jgi:hypothetical protein
MSTTETFEERFARLQAEGRNPVVVDGEIEVDPVSESPMVTTERGTNRPMSTRRDLPKHAGIEIRTSGPDLARGGQGSPARHGDVLAGVGKDKDAFAITVESVGSSGSNANKVLQSDYADGDSTIRGGRPSSEIAIEQRSKLHAGAYERKGPTERRDISDEERLGALRRRVPESMVSEEGGLPIEVIKVRQAAQANKSEADRAAEVRSKMTRRR